MAALPAAGTSTGRACSRSRITERTRCSATAMAQAQKAAAISSSAASIGAAIAGRAREVDRGALVQRAPPGHAEVDDRHVDRAHDGQQRGGAVAAPRIVVRGLQRDAADVQEQQQQFRRQPRIPHPPGAPGRLAPQRSRSTARRRSSARQWAPARTANIADSRVLSTSPSASPEGHREVHHHRHPRRGHVDEDDAVGVALLEVGRRDHQP